MVDFPPFLHSILLFNSYFESSFYQWKSIFDCPFLDSIRLFISHQVPFLFNKENNFQRITGSIRNKNTSHQRRGIPARETTIDRRRHDNAPIDSFHVAAKGLPMRHRKRTKPFLHFQFKQQQQQQITKTKPATVLTNGPRQWELVILWFLFRWKNVNVAMATCRLNEVALVDGREWKQTRRRRRRRRRRHDICTLSSLGTSLFFTGWISIREPKKKRNVMEHVTADSSPRWPVASWQKDNHFFLSSFKGKCFSPPAPPPNPKNRAPGFPAINDGSEKGRGRRSNEPMNETPERPIAAHRWRSTFHEEEYDDEDPSVRFRPVRTSFQHHNRFFFSKKCP